MHPRVEKDSNLSYIPICYRIKRKPLPLITHTDIKTNVRNAVIDHLKEINDLENEMPYGLWFGPGGH